MLNSYDGGGRMDPQELMSVSEARERLLSGVQVLESETIVTQTAIGRVMAEDIFAPMIFLLLQVPVWTVMQSGPLMLRPPVRITPCRFR